ncbi:NADP-dependent 3-hydroxy acid dehydrogenase YdfG [Chitinophaga sp. YR573]|uniref:SDR family NAD(P)-dependent oxidoreductase n=1 Tax=Chitinophaga sp. YR573 TaxID=1881040 RepID=UPI0008BA174C|nr:SDR family NAD(P)-dependent oxidoreductase [Chitinophaga sp. YR573]SEV98455.1 NADP-dependent 3-hydroxy acid dehydrogenase YdfG [Chitinophaga sp. YR573]
MAIVLITGATSGFGEACAKKFAANGYDLIITGRRTERLQLLQQQLEQQHHIKVLPLCFDVRDEKAVTATLNAIPEQWKAVDILINNAGLAMGSSSIDQGEFSDWDTMIDTNVKGLLYVSRTVIPWLKAQGKGHIINLGSTAAKQAYANGNVYCATKAAVDSLSQAMRIDLLPYRIKVTAVHPGAAQTEFAVVRFKGDAEKADNVYKGFTPLKGEDIADTIYYCATLPAHVCINDLVITCLQQANAYYFQKE